MFQSARPVRGATLTPIGRWPPVGFALTMAAMSDIRQHSDSLLQVGPF
jgi:hypothetical protein